jgi:hypothetical protein
MSPFLAYCPYFEKIKIGLWNHLAVCVYLYEPPNSYLVPELKFIKLCLCTVVPEPIETTYLISLLLLIPILQPFKFFR